VQNCAQIDRKCTLFRPKTPFFAHFCRGEGRLFGRPKNPDFRGLSPPLLHRRRDTFPDDSHVSQHHDATRCVIFYDGECSHILFNALTYINTLTQPSHCAAYCAKAIHCAPHPPSPNAHTPNPTRLRHRNTPSPPELLPQAVHTPREIFFLKN
jgi:hypothetical protein